MKKILLLLSLLCLFVSGANAGEVTVTSMLEGDITTALSTVSATTTSDVINVKGFSKLLVESDLTTVLTGTPAWTVKVQGALSKTGTFSDLYNLSTAQTTGSITADRIMYIESIPSYIKIVATEGTDNGTITVRVQPSN